MADEKVVKYIKDNLKKGFSKEDIRKALLKAKYKKAIVDEAFQGINTSGKKPASLVLLIIIGVIIICGFVSYQAYNYVYDQSSYMYMVPGQHVCELKIAGFATDSPLLLAGVGVGETILSINDVDINFSYLAGTSNNERIYQLISIKNPVSIRTEIATYNVELPSPYFGISVADVNCTDQP